jgi:hypothetical protein
MWLSSLGASRERCSKSRTILGVWKTAVWLRSETPLALSS